MRAVSKILRGLLLAAVLIAANGAAVAQPIEFKAPTVGTRVIPNTGGYLEIVKVDGKTIRTTNRNGQQADWIGGVFFVPRHANLRIPVELIESLWPLEVGKSIAFQVSGVDGGGYSGVWNYSMTVLRLETLSLPAGTFETAAVEVKDTWGPDIERVMTLWFSPEVGFIVQRELRSVARTYSPPPTKWFASEVRKP